MSEIWISSELQQTFKNSDVWGMARTTWIEEAQRRVKPISKEVKKQLGEWPMAIELVDPLQQIALSQLQYAGLGIGNKEFMGWTEIDPEGTRQVLDVVRKWESNPVYKKSLEALRDLALANNRDEALAAKQQSLEAAVELYTAGEKIIFFEVDDYTTTTQFDNNEWQLKMPEVQVYFGAPMKEFAGVINDGMRGVNKIWGDTDEQITPLVMKFLGACGTVPILSVGSGQRLDEPAGFMLYPELIEGSVELLNLAVKLGLSPEKTYAQLVKLHGVHEFAHNKGPKNLEELYVELLADVSAIEENCLCLTKDDSAAREATLVYFWEYGRQAGISYAQLDFQDQGYSIAGNVIGDYMWKNGLYVRKSADCLAKPTKKQLRAFASYMGSIRRTLAKNLKLDQPSTLADEAVREVEMLKKWGSLT